MDIALDKIRATFPEFVATPSLLAKRVPLVNGNGTIDFSLLENGNNAAVGLESFLNMDDAFVVTHIGLGLLNEVVAEIGQAQLQTYENNTEFTVAGVTPANLGKLYNGQMAVTVGQNKIIDKYPTRNFRVVNTTQQSSATTKSEILPRNGFAESNPLLILSGKGKHKFTVTRPSSATEGVQSTVATNVVYAVLLVQGYTVFGAGNAAQNLTKFQ